MNRGFVKLRRITRQTFQKKYFLPSIARILTFIFVFSNIAFAHLPALNAYSKESGSRQAGLPALNAYSKESGSRQAGKPKENVWKERRDSIQVASLPSTFALPRANSGSAIQQNLLKSSLSPEALLKATPQKTFTSKQKKKTERIVSLPDTFFSHVNVKEVFKGSSAKTVVLLEDVHMNKEAQEHISSAIKSFDQSATNSKMVIGLEGAAGGFLYDAYKQLPRQDIAASVADEYLAKGEISGPAHAGFTSKSSQEGRLVFWGVDDVLNYRKNVAAYKNSHKVKKAVSGQLAAARQLLEKNKATTFSSELKKFDAAVSVHRSGSLSLGEYALTLAKTASLNSKKSANPSFNFETFLEAYFMEKAINFAQVEKERQAVIEKLVRLLSKSELDTLIDMSLAYQQGSYSFSDYYRELQTVCQKVGVNLAQTPAFDNYIRYVLLADGVNGEGLLKELDRLENQVYASLATTEKEQKLIAQEKELVLSEQLTEFSLTSHQWEGYRKGNINQSNLETFEEFYISADKRSQAMVENLISKMNQEKASSAVLVSGGFHTAEIADLLREKGLSFIIASPKLTKVDGSATAYLSVFDREKSSLEQIFAGEKLFVAPPPAGQMNGAGTTASVTGGNVGGQMAYQTVTKTLFQSTLNQVSGAVMAILRRLGVPVISMIRSGQTVTTTLSTGAVLKSEQTDEGSISTSPRITTSTFVRQFLIRFLPTQKLAAVVGSLAFASIAFAGQTGSNATFSSIPGIGLIAGVFLIVVVGSGLRVTQPGSLLDTWGFSDKNKSQSFRLEIHPTTLTGVKAKYAANGKDIYLVSPRDLPPLAVSRGKGRFRLIGSKEIPTRHNLEVSNDGKWVADWDETSLGIVNTKSGERKRIPVKGPIQNFKGFSPNSQFAVYVKEDGSLNLIDLKTLRSKKIKDSVFSDVVAFSANGDAIAFTSNPGWINYFNFKKDQVGHNHRARGNLMALHPTEPVVLTVEGTLVETNLLDTQWNKLIKFDDRFTFDQNTKAVYSPDARWIAIGNMEGEVIVIDRTGQKNITMMKVSREITSLEFSRESDSLLFADSSGMVYERFFSPEELGEKTGSKSTNGGIKGKRTALIGLVAGVLGLGITAQEAVASVGAQVITAASDATSSVFPGAGLFVGIALVLLMMMLRIVPGETGSYLPQKRVWLDDENAIDKALPNKLGIDQAEIDILLAELQNRQEQIEKPAEGEKAESYIARLIAELRFWRESGNRQIPAVNKWIEDTKAAAKTVRDLWEKGKIHDVVIIGVGGSDLGGRALHEMLAGGRFYNEIEGKGPRIHFLGDNYEEDDLINLQKINGFDWSKTLLLPISKSGKTPEPLATYEILKSELIKALGSDDYGDHVIAVTGMNKDSVVFQENEALKGKSTAEKKRGFAAILPVPDGIGGRFSVLSPVGLIYAGIAGLDVDALVEGFEEGARLTRELPANDPNNVAYRLASLLYISQDRRHHGLGKTKLHFFMYGPFRSFGLWFQQLYNESLGQTEEIHMTAQAHVGPTSQHSDQQRIGAGAKDGFVLFTEIDYATERLRIPETAALSYMRGRSLHEARQAARAGTAAALTKEGHMNATVHLDRIDERTIGQYISILFRTIDILGNLHGINPFIQEWVEKGKKETARILDEKGEKEKSGQTAVEASAGDLASTGVHQITDEEAINTEAEHGPKNPLKFRLNDETLDQASSERLQVQEVNVPTEELAVPIKGGTAGWRDGYVDPNTQKNPSPVRIVAEKTGFTMANVGRFAQAFAGHVLSKGIKDRVAVGYDAREYGADFAKLIVSVLRANGVEADLVNLVTPTPVMGEATRSGQKYKYAVHVTASHNPLYRSLNPLVLYMGIKILEGGAPAGDDTWKLVSERANNKAVNGTYKTLELDFDSISNNKLIHDSDSRLSRAFNFLDLKAKLSLMIKGRSDIQHAIIDAMHGATGKASNIIRDLLDNGVMAIDHIRTIPISTGGAPITVRDRDGKEEIYSPDPTKAHNSPEYNQQLTDASIGFKLDGDGDRLVFHDINKKEISPNDLGFIFAHYLITRKGQKGALVRTFPTTNDLDLLAKAYDLELIETPVGSKNFAAYMGKMLIAVEESGHIFFKLGDELFVDSAVAEAMLVLEIMAETGKTLTEYYEEAKADLKAKLGEKGLPAIQLFYKKGEINPTNMPKGFSDFKSFKIAYSHLRSTRPDLFAALLAHRLGKSLLLDEKGELVPGASFHTKDGTGIMVRFSDSSWVMIRMSGTEDVGRIYGEALSTVEVVQQEEMVRAVLAEMLAALSVSVEKINLNRPSSVVIPQAIINMLHLTGLKAADLNDRFVRDFAINLYNAFVGGLRQVISGRTPEQVKPVPTAIAASDSVRIADHLQAIKEGSRAWMVFAGGRATRMKLPSQFDVLGIGGLTPAILKRLKAKGYTTDLPVTEQQAEEFSDLIDRAHKGVIESEDELSFIQRDLLQLWMQVETDSKANGLNPEEVVKGLRFVVTVNPDNKTTIQNQMAALKFPGKIFFIEQPEEGGVAVNSQNKFEWDDVRKYPEGHGQPFLQMVDDKLAGAILTEFGSLKSLGEPLRDTLANSGVKHLMFAQVNDLHLLGNMVAYERWETSLNFMKQKGAEMVLEMVDNGRKQKGGGPFLVDESGKIVLRDTLAMKTVDLAAYTTPVSISRMFYVIDLNAMKKLNRNSLPPYLTVRPLIRFTLETYSGDATSVLDSYMMQESGFAIKTFKERKTIDEALGVIETQNGQGATLSFLNEKGLVVKSQNLVDGSQGQSGNGSVQLNSPWWAGIAAAGLALLGLSSDAFAQGAGTTSAQVGSWSWWNIVLLIVGTTAFVWIIALIDELVSNYQKTGRWILRKPKKEDDGDAQDYQKPPRANSPWWAGIAAAGLALLGLSSDAFAQATAGPVMAAANSFGQLGSLMMLAFLGFAMVFYMSSGKSSNAGGDENIKEPSREALLKLGRELLLDFLPLKKEEQAGSVEEGADHYLIEALLRTGPHGKIFNTLTETQVRIAYNTVGIDTKLPEEVNQAKMDALLAYLVEVRTNRVAETSKVFSRFEKLQTTAQSIVTVVHVGEVESQQEDDLNMLGQVLSRADRDNQSTESGAQRNHDVVVVLHPGLSDQRLRQLGSLVNGYLRNTWLVRVDEIHKTAGQNYRSYNTLLQFVNEEKNGEFKAVNALLEGKADSSALRTFSRVPGEFRADGALAKVWTILMNLGSGWAVIPIDTIIKAAEAAAKAA